MPHPLYNKQPYMEYIVDMPDMEHILYMPEKIYDNMPRKHTMYCGIPWFLTQDVGDMFGKYITDDIFLGEMWRKVE